MKKKFIGIVILTSFLLIVGFVIFINSIYSGRIGPCFGYTEIGEFKQKINSEYDAKRIVINYFSSIGCDAKPEDLVVSNNKRWYVGLNYNPLNEKLLDCLKNAIPSEPTTCTITSGGTGLFLEEKLFSNNKILCQYLIAC